MWEYFTFKFSRVVASFQKDLILDPSFQLGLNFHISF